MYTIHIESWIPYLSQFEFYQQTPIPVAFHIYAYFSVLDTQYQYFSKNIWLVFVLLITQLLWRMGQMYYSIKLVNSNWFAAAVSKSVVSRCCNCLVFLVDSIFVDFARKVWQQTVDIPMGTNCAPPLADIFLYSYKAEIIPSLLLAGKRQLASRFGSIHRWYIVLKQPYIISEKISGQDVSCWIWDQRHDREQHFCFLHRFTFVDRVEWPSSQFHLRWLMAFSSHSS